MPPLRRRKQRRTAIDESEEEEIERQHHEEQVGQQQQAAAATQQQRRRPEADSEDEEAEEEAEAEDGDADASDAGAEMDVDGEPNPNGTQTEGSLEQLVKKFVRYALACEYARVPIRRDGVRDKVFGKHRTPFKKVFDATQNQLRLKFGMEMVELPTKEKVTLRDRRAAAAQKSQAQSQGKKSANPSSTTTTSNSNSYILTSILPSPYKSYTIIAPSNIPIPATEASYTALYTMIISLITLNGGSLANPKLERYMKRLNLEVHMLPGEGGTTDAILQKMVRQGYITRTREIVGGEESIEWGVGARGKVEVGRNGVEGLVRRVYGVNTGSGSGAGEGDEEAEGVREAEAKDLEERLGHSLGLFETSANSQRKRQRHDGGERHEQGATSTAAEQENGSGGKKKKRGRPSKRALAMSREEDSDEGDEEDEDDDADAQYAY